MFLPSTPGFRCRQRFPRASRKSLLAPYRYAVGQRGRSCVSFLFLPPQGHTFVGTRVLLLVLFKVFWHGSILETKHQIVGFQVYSKLTKVVRRRGAEHHTGVNDLGLSMEEIQSRQDPPQGDLKEREVERLGIQSHQLEHRHVHWLLHETLVLPRWSVKLERVIKLTDQRLTRVRRLHSCEVFIYSELAVCCRGKPTQRRRHFDGYVLFDATNVH